MSVPEDVWGEVWHPDPGWQPARGGRSASTWLANDGGRPVVVKRLARPEPGDAAELTMLGHGAYWRREADVALDGSLATTRGVRSPEVLRVEEDDAGVTLWTRKVEPAPDTGPHLAHALGMFAGNDLVVQPWWSQSLLTERLDRVAVRGGWPTLARTTLADVADLLWQRRGRHLSRLVALPSVPAHGDPTPANLPARDGDDVLGIDWASFGSSAVGADAGYLALSAREDFDTLVEAYADGLGHDLAEVREGAAIVACYTALTRTEWALASVATGPGALAGKYRHPSVAPYIRALQRLFPQLETLL
ncbi:MAG: hypothetical protein JWO46_1448 [Nocardioidaceae bacterium]|nr:hypothetical protein [Nocardioidaceae bacterium]